ncbi:hypothetical protein H2201_002195 [Coniosporium apollinis]|uniref:MARVEL domain-containing protein n=2 Tax=Coniosporium TaxID=2810619 RepID=A0ABQ9P265_9PEZI|nr:hypothetical protein H2199_005629 [Cladosporium sp. JES 115]KAJ9667660.1 hypothetical protein H2201_002195 [Coniosporium apollinis]
MARVRDANNPWLKRVLIPFWVIRGLVEIFFIGGTIYLLAAGGNTRSSQGAYLVSLLFNLTLAALDIASIVLYSRHNLKPKIFLIFNVVGCAIWLIVFLMTIPYAMAGDHLSISIAVAIFIVWLGPLIYASVIYHRTRKALVRGQYAPAANPYAGTPYAPVELSSTAAPQHPYQQSPYEISPQEYYSPHAAPQPTAPQSTAYTQHTQPQSTGYTLPPPHPSQSPAPYVMPARHPSAQQGLYVMPAPYPNKGAVGEAEAVEMPATR